MKKILVSVLVLCLLPLMLLSGCDNFVTYKIQTVSQIAPNFFGQVNKSINDYYEIANEYDKDNISNTTAMVNSVNAVYEKLWTNINNANKEVLFATVIYDMYNKYKNTEINVSVPYDLSALSSASGDKLSDFILKSNGKTEEENYYYYSLLGTETSNFLPTLEDEKVSSTTNIDLADDMIEKWGRVISFTVKALNVHYTQIVAEVGYQYPSSYEVPNQPLIENSNIQKIIRDDEHKLIKIVYKIGNDTFTKIVFFEEEDNVIKKVVKKYSGNVSETPLTDLEELSFYNYSNNDLDIPANAPNLFGEYIILFNYVDGLIYCDHNNNITELVSLKYDTKSANADAFGDVIMAKYSKKVSTGYDITKILIKEDGVSANIVNKIQNKKEAEDLKQQKEFTSNYATYNKVEGQGSSSYYAFTLFGQEIKCLTK